MQITHWVDKKIDDIKDEPLFTLYFSGVELTDDDDRYYIINENIGIDLVIDLDKKITSIHLYPNYSNSSLRAHC